MQTIDAYFRSRREADLALEHLVQDHGLERTNLFVRSATQANTTGVETAGGDAAAGRPGTGRRDDSPLAGEVLLSVELPDGRLDQVRADLEQAGATDIRRH